MGRDLGDLDRAVMCSKVREQISASLDGETPGELSPEQARHLMVCRGCGDFGQRVAALSRQLRLHVFESTPDLSEQILRRISAEAPTTLATRTTQHRRVGRAPRTTRWAAAVIPLGLALSGLTSSAFAQARVLPTHPVTSCTASLGRH
ncbi:MAG: hypothetical protein ABSD85_01385 [Acidimicrobiales bacterium]|jgi:predicted anti-sigma-YlaC factor YlaD